MGERGELPPIIQKMTKSFTLKVSLIYESAPTKFLFPAHEVLNPSYHYIKLVIKIKKRNLYAYSTCSVHFYKN